jgi:CheY-like chemotaxis protein/two-component sensor histidine kinase
MNVEYSNSDLEKAAVVAGRLAHEFGNHLTGILGFTELGLAVDPADGPAQRYFREALESARSSADWLHRLHHFCRRGSAPAWPTALSALLNAEEERYRAETPTGPRWQLDVPAELLLLDIDVAALQMALGELVRNSQEAGSVSALTISARLRELRHDECADLLGAVQPGPHVELTVADDGPGIPVEVRERLFRDVFSSQKPKHRGLGLLVVYGILVRARGGLRLAAPEATGTTLQLYIPVASIDAPACAAPAPRVLLVHRPALLLESMRRLLASSGCEVTVCESASEALALHAAANGSFAAILIDLLMPFVAGLDLARRIVESDREANVLFLHTPTSFHALADEPFLRRFPLIRWPITPQAFLKTVHATITQRKEGEQVKSK